MIPSKLPYSLNKKYVIYRSGKVFSRHSGKYVRSHNNNGDPIASIRRGRKQETGFGQQLIRHLVALTFVPNPNNFTDVICINHIRTDCRAKNLRWVSREVATAHWRKKVKRYRSKKRSIQVRQEKAASMTGTKHYKFKGHYCNGDKRYINLKLAAKENGLTVYRLRLHLQNKTAGWSFLPAETSSPHQGSSTFVSDPQHPEAIF